MALTPGPLPQGEGVRAAQRLSVADEIENELDGALVRAEKVWGSILKNAVERNF